MKVLESGKSGGRSRLIAEVPRGICERQLFEEAGVGEVEAWPPLVASRRIETVPPSFGITAHGALWRDPQRNRHCQALAQCQASPAQLAGTGRRSPAP